MLRRPAPAPRRRELNPALRAAARRPVWLFVSGVLLAVGAFFFFVGAPWLHQTPPYHIDFDVYRMGGKVFLSGGDIYGELPELARGDHLPFTYPPFSAVLFSLFAVMPLEVGGSLLTLGTVLCLWYTLVAVTCFTWNIGRREAARLVLPVLALGLWIGPVRETIFFGQINALLMAAILFGLFAGLLPRSGIGAGLADGQGHAASETPRRTPLWGPILVGVVASIKLTPLVFGIFYLVRRDLRGAFAMAGGVALGVGAGFAFLPSASMQYWTETILSSDRIGAPMFASNQSLNGALHRLLGDGTTTKAVWALLVLVVVAVIAWCAARLSSAGLPAEAAMAVALISLLASPVSWGHHWVWIMPIIVVFSARAFPRLSTTPEFRAYGNWNSARIRFSGVVIWAGLLVGFLTPYWLVPRSDGHEVDWNAWQTLVGDAVLLWGLLAVALFLTAAAAAPRAGLWTAARGIHSPK
ncbi:glycosyltransferase 87 family protein [Dietzia sp.]|uniref:glycosyltransferase 87 family protein n=1 Tax=Dietzia sp. TaxID=1871616 RepID=UPI002FD9C308